MKKTLTIISILMLIIISSKEYNKIIIPNESIRIRVIANSNKLEDQLLKLKIKEEVTTNLYDKLDNIKTKEEAKTKIENSIPELENIVSTTLNNNNFKINYGQNYFPQKEFNGITYEEGDYESLVINLGESKGDNWWCVLFPPLCMIEAEYTDKDNVEYKSKVLEILNEYN